jgi:subtilase family serine protease
MTELGLLPVLLACAGLFLPAQALPSGPGARPLIDDLDRVTVPGSIHPRLAALPPSGPAAPDLPMARMILALKLAPDARARLDQLLRDQQDPASPRYHQWLTPDAFGRQFGTPRAELDAATGWLAGQGFTVASVARSGLAITFSGTAVQVGKAFRTTIVDYDLDGVTRHGNATPISLPRGLAAFADGVVSLNDLGRRSLARKAGPLAWNRGTPRPESARPQVAVASGGNAVGPGDFAAIYGLAPLFQAGTTGAGVTIGVVGRCDLATSDWTAFTDAFGPSLLPARYTGSLQVVHNGTDPGVTSSDEEFEADTDTQWATAAAPGATIDFVVSASSYTTDGADLSAQYIVDNLLAPVMTMSFGACEEELGTAGTTFYQQLWAQAASEGISVCVATGDAGAAGCDGAGEPEATGGRAVSGLASTPFNTAVGGTQFQVAQGAPYWSTTTTGYATSALGYIPEQAWNESTLGFGIMAGGGGASAVYPTPAWQSAYGVPATPDARFLPDVAFISSAETTPLITFQEGQAYLGGGTSFASPAMAGIMALVVQKYGSQGNADFALYNLARAQFANLYQGGASAPAVFHDVTSGNNSVPGVTGYSAGNGYDEATGLGSLDAAVLVSNWPGAVPANPISGVTISSPASTTASGTALSPFTGSADYTGNPASLSFTWNWGDGTSSAGAANTPIGHTYTITGRASQTFHATLTVSDGTYVDAQSIPIVVTPAGVSAVIGLPATSPGVLPGVAVAFSVDTANTFTLNQGASLAGYVWDFGDGASATGSSASHAFADNPSTPYTVTLTVTDSTGAQGTATLQVYADTSVMDVAGNGVIDVRDLLVICGAWNPSLQATDQDLNGLDVFADLNGDGRVDDTDINLWIANFTPGVAL